MVASSPSGDSFHAVMLVSGCGSCDEIAYCIPAVDDNRVALKAIGSREDCQHDYINASYIDVSHHSE